MARVIIALMVVLAASSTYATIIHVPTDQPTIQAGVDAANDFDTVLVEPGIYFERIDFHFVDVVLASNYLVTGSESDIETTVINGGGIGNVVTVAHEQSPASKLCGFTVENGGGAGVACGGNSQIVIEHNIIQQNLGGGISAYNASPAIQFNTIRSNESPGEGGGIYCFSVGYTIRGNLIVDNHSGTRGGGIFHYYSSAAIENNTIVGNSADSGGAICYQRSGGLAVIRN